MADVVHHGPGPWQGARRSETGGEGDTRAGMDEREAGAMHGPSNRATKRKRTATVPVGPAGDAVLNLIATVNELGASKEEACKLADKQTRLLHKKKEKLKAVWKQRDALKKELDQATKALTKELGERTDELDQCTQERDYLEHENKRLKQTPSLARLPEVEGQEPWQMDITFKDYLGLLKDNKQLTMEHFELSWDCAENIQAYDECVKEGDEKVAQVRAQRNTARQERNAARQENTKLKEDKTQLEADKTQLEARVATLIQDLKQAQDKKRIDKKEGKKRRLDEDGD